MKKQGGTVTETSVNVGRGSAKRQSISSLDDSDSQKHIVNDSLGGIVINHDIRVSHENTNSDETLGRRART